MLDIRGTFRSINCIDQVEYKKDQFIEGILIDQGTFSFITLTETHNTYEMIDKFIQVVIQGILVSTYSSAVFPFALNFDF